MFKIGEYTISVVSCGNVVAKLNEIRRQKKHVAASQGELKVALLLVLVEVVLRGRIVRTGKSLEAPLRRRYG